MADLTLREQAAVSALQGILEAKYGFIGEIDPKLTASVAVRLADALVDELEKTKKDEER